MPQSKPQSTQAKTHYTILGLTPWANERQIRQAYRELSKLYHPDTTQLNPEIAVEQFRLINAAYGTLTNPERRSLYDRSIQFTQIATAPIPDSIVASDRPLRYDSGLPSERPLSGGEMFALLILAFTFFACLVLVFLVGLVRGDQLLPLSL